MTVSIVIGIILLIVVLIMYREYRNEKRYQEERRKKEALKERKLTPKVTKRLSGTATETGKEEHPAPSRPKPTHLQQQSTPEHQEAKVRTPQKEVTAPSQPVPTPKPSPQTSRRHTPAHTETVTPQATSKPAPQRRSEERNTSTPQKPAPAQNKPHTPKPSEVTKAERAVTLPKGEYPEFNYQRLLEMGLSEEEAKEFIQELIPQIGDQIPLIDEAMKVPDFHKMERLTHSIKGSSTTIGTGGVSDLLVEFNTYLKEGENVQIAQAYQAHLKRYFGKLKKQFPQEG